jgi:hypothetical protein
MPTTAVLKALLSSQGSIKLLRPAGDAYDRHVPVRIRGLPRISAVSAGETLIQP